MPVENIGCHDLSSENQNTFFESVNNEHLLDTDNGYLAHNSLSNYIESNTLRNYCYKNSKNDSQNLTTILLNILSLVNLKTFTTFDAWSHSLNFLPDIIAINETWEKESSNGQFKNLFQYNYISNFRKNHRGGGVALYIKETLQYNLRPDLTIMHEGVYESPFVDIHPQNDTIICGTIYRPAKQDKVSNELFVDHLKSALDIIHRSKCKVFLMRDLNYDLLEVSHKYSTIFIDTMFDNSFYPIINKPTRITQNSSKCIDHLWTNIHNKIIKKCNCHLSNW